MLRAEGANVAKPVWRGQLFERSQLVMQCAHDSHPDSYSARLCALGALSALRRAGKLPDGWSSP